MEVQIFMIGIYKFENKINGHIYIGQSVNIEQRYKDHINRALKDTSGNTEYNSLIHKAIRKYGIKNFNFSIIEECSKEKLNEREQYWISFYDSFNNGYNCNSGGNQQEATIKFSENIIKEIQNLLQNSSITYEEISKKYNISLGKISSINTGKSNFNNSLTYPLRSKKKNIKKFCLKCGILITNNAKYCSKCINLKKIIPLEKMPVTREELKLMIRTMPFTKIGKHFGVSDNSIRKWCDKFNLPRKKTEINKMSDEDWQKV